MDSKIQKSKRAMRRKLAALPIVEKLWMLDAMRERDAAIRGKLRRRETEGTVALMRSRRRTN